MQAFFKLCAIMVILFGSLSTAVAGNGSENDTLDISKERLKDQSVRDLPFTVEKKEDPLYTGMITLHPRAIPFVKDYLEIHETRLIRMKSTATPYFQMIDNILASQNLPRELKYLAVIESDLKSSATSWVGAVGPWQFMPETGRLM